jgi:MFS family permease
VTVRVLFATGIALGVSLTAVELLWQPRLADLLGDSGTEGFVFGALAAASMLAVAAGAGLSPVVARRLGLRPAYMTMLGVGAVCVAVLGTPASPLAFAAVYLLAYALLGLAEPMHYELLNDAVGSKARATLMSAESFATQSGSLVANLGLGAFAAAQGVGATWVLAGVVLGATCAAIARPLLRTRGAPRAAAQPTPKPLHPPLRFDPPPE